MTKRPSTRLGAGMQRCMQGAHISIIRLEWEKHTRKANKEPKVGRLACKSDITHLSMAAQARRFCRSHTPEPAYDTYQAKHTPQTQPHHTRFALHPLQSQPCMRRLFVHLETYQRRGLNISLNMQMLVHTKKRRPRNVQTSAALTGWRKLFNPYQRKQSQRLDSNTGFNQSCGERKLPLNRLRCFTCLSSQNLELQKKMLVF